MCLEAQHRCCCPTDLRITTAVLLQQLTGLSAAAPGTGLSLELLARVLQHVPLQERMKVCATVHSAWKAAAVKTTTSISTTYAPPVEVLHLLPWLKAHGSHLTSLTIQPVVIRRPLALLELPCAGLRALKLNDALVQLTPTAGGHELGVLYSCRALASLYLRNCNILGTCAELAGLSVLTLLQELSVTWDADCSR